MGQGQSGMGGGPPGQGKDEKDKKVSNFDQRLITRC